ncbi:20301_t:CDS:2 [Rhizophagus irregularis]|nr:20301_t:CDS:2 [Rhizophagus irregularis]
MEKFECLISTFIGEDIIQINPEIFSGELLHILITYDEYLFYSNDNQPIVWEPIAIAIMAFNNSTNHDAIPAD